MSLLHKKTLSIEDNRSIIRIVDAARARVDSWDDGAYNGLKVAASYRIGIGVCDQRSRVCLYPKVRRAKPQCKREGWRHEEREEAFDLGVVGPRGSRSDAVWANGICGSR